MLSMPEVSVPSAAVTFPSPSNVVSSRPLGWYRTRAKSFVDPVLANPPTTILPSACRAIAPATSFELPIVVVSFPSPSNVVSSDPFALYRTTAMS